MQVVRIFLFSLLLWEYMGGISNSMLNSKTKQYYHLINNILFTSINPLTFNLQKYAPLARLFL